MFVDNSSIVSNDVMTVPINQFFLNFDLFRCLKTLNLQRKKCTIKYTSKPYEPALYPDQKVKVDVKVVPTSCIIGKAKRLEQKSYQYTVIDEYTRLRYLAAQSTYSSMCFMQQRVKAFPFNIEKVQTDNGFEFTKRFSKDREYYFYRFEAFKSRRNMRRN